MSDHAVVSVAWLRANLDAPGIALLDASWHMPASGRSAHSEFLEVSLPGAGFFDIDQIADQGSTLPHSCPSGDDFALAMQALGIRNSDFVVVYDSLGMFSAARAWWLLRLFGHRRVAVLAGGLPAWQAQGLPTVPGAPPSAASEPFRVQFNEQLIARFEDVARAVDGDGSAVLDARSPGRFTGAEPEPRPGLASGHMPGAINIPFNHVLDTDKGTLKSAEELRLVFGDQLLPSGADVITSCGSGVTACVLALALHTLGITARVYDGSWCEWASRAPDTIELGGGP